MSYRVIWRERIQLSIRHFTFLAFELGRGSEALRLAVSEIERRLALAPLAEGESRDGPVRVLIVHPLTVIIEAFEAERVVLIYAAVYYPRMRA